MQVDAHGTLDPATHAYTFWEGVPVKARAAFGSLFAKSSTLQCVAIVQRAIRKDTPAALMAKYGFGELNLVATVKGVPMSGQPCRFFVGRRACCDAQLDAKCASAVTLLIYAHLTDKNCCAGSQRSFTGYVFERASPRGKPFKGDAKLLLSAVLDAPRLKQVTLPRMLRSRAPRTASCSRADSEAENSALTSNVSEATPMRPPRRSASVGTEPVPVHTPTSRAVTRTEPAPAQALRSGKGLPTVHATIPAAKVSAVKSARKGKLSSSAKPVAFGLATSGFADHLDKVPAAVAARGRADQLELSPSKRPGALKQCATSPLKKTRAGGRIAAAAAGK